VHDGALRGALGIVQRAASIEGKYESEKSWDLQHRSFLPRMTCENMAGTVSRTGAKCNIASEAYDPFA